MQGQTNSGKVVCVSSQLLFHGTLTEHLLTDTASALALSGFTSKQLFPENKENAFTSCSARGEPNYLAIACGQYVYTDKLKQKLL